MRRLLALIALSALAACGGDDSTNDTATDAGATDTGGSSDTAANDTGGGATDTGGRVDTGGTTDGPPLTRPDVPGPCQRLVYTNGDTETPFYTMDFDYADAPDRVVVTRTDRDGNVEIFTYRDIESERACRRPPEEYNEAFLDLVGCPSRVDTDRDGDGRQAPADRSYLYLYDPNGFMIASDVYDAGDTWLGQRWSYRYNNDGRLLDGTQETENGQVASLLFTVSDDASALTTTIDRGLDGDDDDRTDYTFDSNGRVTGASGEKSDPGTGELRLRTSSSYDWSCWD